MRNWRKNKIAENQNDPTSNKMYSMHTNTVHYLHFLFSCRNGWQDIFVLFTIHRTLTHAHPHIPNSAHINCKRYSSLTWTLFLGLEKDHFETLFPSRPFLFFDFTVFFIFFLCRDEKKMNCKALVLCARQSNEWTTGFFFSIYSVQFNRWCMNNARPAQARHQHFGYPMRMTEFIWLNARRTHK